MTMILIFNFFRLPEPPASLTNPPSKVRNWDYNISRDLEKYIYPLLQPFLSTLKYAESILHDMVSLELCIV
jgi:hypothetical protein